MAVGEFSLPAEYQEDLLKWFFSTFDMNVEYRHDTALLFLEQHGWFGRCYEDGIGTVPPLQCVYRILINMNRWLNEARKRKNGTTTRSTISPCCFDTFLDYTISLKWDTESLAEEGVIPSRLASMPESQFRIIDKRRREELREGDDVDSKNAPRDKTKCEYSWGFVWGVKKKKSDVIDKDRDPDLSDDTPITRREFEELQQNVREILVVVHELWASSSK